jgi:hypothetical protein
VCRTTWYIASVGSDRTGATPMIVTRTMAEAAERRLADGTTLDPLEDRVICEEYWCHCNPLLAPNHIDTAVDI